MQHLRTDGLLRIDVLVTKHGSYKYPALITIVEGKAGAEATPVWSFSL
jgi:hypothetical protein